MASTPRYSNLVLLCAMLIIDSTNYLSSMFFNSESLGLLFALTGLIVLLSPRGVNWRRALFSGLLFGAAFQTKEVYVFTALIGVIICLTFPIEESTRFRLCGTYIIGGVASQLLIGAALTLEGALASYREVLNFKSTIFPFPSFEDLLTRLQYLETELQIYYLNLSLLVLLALLISIYRHRIFNWHNPLISYKLLRLNGIYLIFLVFISIGFAWQGKPMFGHYGITVIFPIMIVIFAVGFSTIRVLASCVTRRSRKLSLSILAFAIMIAPSMSNFNVVSVNLEKANDTKQMLRSLSLENGYSNYYSVITSQSTSDECIQVAYGWGAAAIYNYSDRKSCTRYFLANLILSSAVQLEMRTELIANPPKLIIYSVDGADLDVQSFEQNVFPYESVINSCYKQTSNNNIWVARSGKFETSSCIKDILKLI